MPLLSIGRLDPVKSGDRDAIGVSGKNVKGVVGVNLTTFRYLINDFARPYYFQINIPAIDDSSHVLSMLAKTTILPTMTIEDKGFDFQGSKYKMAGHATFDDWNVTFVADEYHKVRHRFLAWQSLIFDPIRQIPFTAGSYKRNDVQVIQLSKTGEVVTSYQFFGLYPTRVGEIQLGHGNKEVEEFTVTFAYDYFIINTEIANTSTNKDADISKYSPPTSDNKLGRNSQGVTDSVDNKVIHDINARETILTDKANNTDKDYSGKSKTSAVQDSKDKWVMHDINARETLLVDKAGNADQDYNGRGNTEPAPLGFVADQLKKLNPFGRNGDINTEDPFTFLDAANWMNFRYSPPLSFRIRKYLGKDVNEGIDKFRVPEINPYAWTGLQKPK
jgi:hypothetical protein